MIDEGLVVSFEKLEGFGDAGHCSGCGSDDVLEFCERGHLVGDEAFAVGVDFLLEFAILNTLG